MILPPVRDPRLVTIRRGGTLTDSDHRLLALWAAECAEHVLPLFESGDPDDLRPRLAIEHARDWAGGASASGSAIGSRPRSASSCSTTSGFATTSAGRSSTAELLLGALIVTVGHGRAE